MNTEEFIFWLKGALEMNPKMLEEGMSPQQVQTIQDHLNLVFNKVTPNRFEDNSNGNLSPQHPGLTCDDTTLFCEAFGIGTKASINARRDGKFC